MGMRELKPKSEEEWLELRTKVLTASDIGALLGLNRWKSVSQMIESKENFEPFENAYTWLGQQLEPVVVDSVNKVLGTEFKLFENGSRSFFADMELGLGATPDAGDGTTLLECKSTKPGNALRWAEWPPSYYLSQLYTQMYCTGYQEGYLGVLATDLTQQSEELNLPLHIHKITRTDALDAILIKEVNRFWQCRRDGKMYRVNRKQTLEVELMFRFNIRKVYG